MPHSHLLSCCAPTATVELAGWQLAAHYDDPAAEAAAVLSDCGVIDCSERGRIAVTGADRGPWLNDIVSQETADFPAGTWRRALLLTVKGRVACDLRVLALADRFLLDTAFDTADGLLKQLQGYLLYGRRVALADCRESTVLLGVHGPTAGALIAATTGVVTSTMTPGSVAAASDIVIAATDDYGVPGWLVQAPAAAGPALWQQLAATARPFGWEAAEILRITAGRPRWGAELHDERFPLEAELHEAISHTKGCYPGQEFVARMRDRGHANWLLRYLTISGDKVPARAAHVIASDDLKPIGHVTSATRSPAGQVVALAYLKRQFAEPGRRLHVAVAGPPAEAVVSRWQDAGAG